MSWYSECTLNKTECEHFTNCWSPKNIDHSSDSFFFSQSDFTLFTFLNSIPLMSAIKCLRKPHMGQIPSCFTLSHEMTFHPTRNSLKFSSTEGLEARNKSLYYLWPLNCGRTRSYCSNRQVLWLMWLNKELMCQSPAQLLCITDVCKWNNDAMVIIFYT